MNSTEKHSSEVKLSNEDSEDKNSTSSSVSNNKEGDGEVEQRDKSNSDDDNDEMMGVQQLLANMELSADTMQALKEFMQEENERQTKLELIEQGNIPTDFEENWNLSQFWYAGDTADCLAKECLRVITENAAAAAETSRTQGAIACIASPTVYRALHKMEHSSKVSVFEFDTRFVVFGDDFVLYDYRNPLAVPRDLRELYDVIVVDPPYLKEDCLTKVALTIKFVAKPGAKIIICTGLVMQDLAYRLMNLKLQDFKIKHEKDRLSNPFGCFANYDMDEHCKYK